MNKIKNIFIWTLIVLPIPSTDVSLEQLHFPVMSHRRDIFLSTLAVFLWTLFFPLFSFLFFILFFSYYKFPHLWDLSNFRKVLFIYWIKNSVGKEHTLTRTWMVGRGGGAESRAQLAVMKKMTGAPHCKRGTERPWLEFKEGSRDFREKSSTCNISL